MKTKQPKKTTSETVKSAVRKAASTPVTIQATAPSPSLPLPPPPPTPPPPTPPLTPSEHPELGVIPVNIPGTDFSSVESAALTSLPVAKKYLSMSQALAVVAEEDYHYAAKVLSQVTHQHKTDVGLSVLESIIRPIREGLDVLYAVRRRVESPYLEAVETIKSKMAAWQNAERKRREAEKAEELRLLREAEKSQPVDRPEFSHTPFPAPQSLPVQNSSVSTRVVFRARITSMEEFIMAIESGLAPSWNLIQPNEQAINNWLKMDPQAVRECPGIEVYEDTVIIRRG